MVHERSEAFCSEFDIDLYGCKAFFLRTESDWYRWVFMLFSVLFAFETGDLGST